MTKFGVIMFIALLFCPEATFAQDATPPQDPNARAPVIEQDGATSAVNQAVLTVPGADIENLVLQQESAATRTLSGRDRSDAGAITCSFLKKADGTGTFRGIGFETGLKTLITVAKTADKVEHQVAAVLLDTDGVFVLNLSSSVMSGLALEPGVEVTVGLDGQACMTSILSGLSPSAVLPAVIPFRFEGDVRRLERLPIFTAGQGQSNRWRSEGSLSAPLETFDGVTSDSTEQDPVGDVGPDHYVQMINAPGERGNGSAVFAIYDKQHNLLAGPTFLKTLWPRDEHCSTDTSPQQQTEGDPIVLYDPLEDRWLLSQMATGHLCIAISTSADPTQGYYLYTFPVSGGQKPDYFKLGVWPDGYYMSAKISQVVQNQQIQIAVFDRARMLKGDPARAVLFSLPPSRDDIATGRFNIFMPSDLDGSVPPPLGSPNVFYRPFDDETGNDRIELWELHVNWSDPSKSTFAGPSDIPFVAFDLNACDGGTGRPDINGGICIPQKGTRVTLDSLHHKPMWRFQYRNFGTHETLLGNFTIDVDGNDHQGIRWFELRRSGSSAWAKYQEGTQAPQSSNDPHFVHRWLGSIAVDGFGNIALGYSVSNEDMFPSMRYTGRAAADALNTLPQGEKIIINSDSNTGDAFDLGHPWGGYSSMNVDPSDDCTFWYTNNYVVNGKRQTRIASFSFESCNANELRIVNDLVTLTAIDIQPPTVPTDARCPAAAGFVGIYRFNAILTVKSINPLLHNFVLRVNTLTNGNLLIGDGGLPGGVGTTLTNLGTVDRPVITGDTVGNVIEICLRNSDGFSFLVDVLAKNFIR